MTTHAVWATEILEQLDAKAREYDFPVLNNVYFKFIGVDLCAYRSADEWLIAFQLVVLREGEVLNLIYAYGNQLAKVGNQQNLTVSRAGSNVPPLDHLRADFVRRPLDFVQTESQLLDFIVGRKPKTIDVFVHPRKWQHPDVAGEDELPSASPSFQQLAKSLADGVAPPTPNLDGELNLTPASRWDLE